MECAVSFKNRLPSAFLCAIIFFLAHNCSAKTSADTVFRGYMQLHGFKNEIIEKATRAVFLGHHIAVYIYAGCADNDPAQYVAENNKKIFKFLADNEPGVTEETIRKEIDSYALTQRKIDKVVNALSFIKNIKKTKYPVIFNDWQKVNATDEYMVVVSGCKLKSPKNKRTLYTLKIYLDTRYVLRKQADGQWNECTK